MTMTSKEMKSDLYTYTLPELSPEEKKMPLSRFYTDYPLYKPSPLQQQILDSGPMNWHDAIQADHWLDLLEPYGYRDVVYGYCMMPDGSGFYIEYSVNPPTWQSKWRRWWGEWVNHSPRGTVKGQGNLKYKLWNPLDHWDHQYVNGKDDTEGIWSVETLDMGLTGDASKGIPSICHNLDIDKFLTDEKKKQLADAGCRASACWEEFEGPGHHLVLRFSRPAPNGGMENINCEWIGYYIFNGVLVRDETTPVDETYLKNVLIHNSVERVHLQQILPDIYEAYHDLPMDAD